MKNDRLDAMILLSAHVLAEKNETDLMSVDTSNIKIPNSIDRRIMRMINREHRKSEYGTIFKAAKRVAVVVLVICTAAFTLAMSVEAVRNAFWSTIIRWYEDYIAVSYVVDKAPPEFIEVKKEPSAIPDDWTREVKLDSESMYYIQYSLNSEATISFKQKLLDGDEDLIDNENSTVENIKIQEYDGNLITLLDKRLSYLVWSDGCYSYTISYDNSKVNRALAIDIAESLQ